MKKLVVLLVFALVVGGFGFALSNSKSSEPELFAGVAAKDVFTFVCEIPKQKKPNLIYFACADGNAGIGKIKWNTWEASGASGIGEYFENDCKPSCADGKFSFTDVNVKLSKPILAEAKVHLSRMTYEEIGRISGKTGSLDLAEFYLPMAEN